MLLLGAARIQTANAANIALIFQHTYWWPYGESGLYRPFTTLSYLLNYAILGNGNRPAGYHWINFLLHLVNVYLVFALALRLMAGKARAFRTAFFIALLWSVHPVLTESVTNMVGRADLLAGFAVLSGFLLYLESRETTGWRRGAALAGLGVVTAIGVFSKESAVVLPAVIVLYELVCGKQWRAMLAGVLATLVPVGVMLWQRTAVLSSTLPAEYAFLDNPIARAGFWTGRLTAIKVLARYLWLALWPMKLSADYSYSQIALARGAFDDWICWLAVAAALALMAVLWNRNRLAFFLGGFALLSWLPASNLLFPTGTIMAERLLYLPLVGLVAAAIVAIDAELGRFGVSGTALAICVAVIAAGFAARTWKRNLDWTDDKSMALANIQTSPRSYKAHQVLAGLLLEADPSHPDIDGAMAQADHSVAILASVPDELDLPGPWNLAAVCHRDKGDALGKGAPGDALRKGATGDARALGDDARVQYEEAVRLALRSIAIDAASRAAYDRRYGMKGPVPAIAAEGYRTLASAYYRLGRAQQALSAATQAQTIDPANTGVYGEMAESDLALERPEDAAIALAEGVLATGDPGLRSELVKLYRSGLDSAGCAVVAGAQGPALNPSCDIVRRDLCVAATRAGSPALRRRLACPD